MSYSTLVILNTRQDLLDYVSENSGQEVDVSTMFQIRDPLICEVRFLTQLKISLPCLTARRKRERERELGIEIGDKICLEKYREYRI